MNTKDKKLFYLHELSDYKVSNDDKDVRGWNIKDRNNLIIGKVDNLLVKKKTERVVYLDIEVDESIIGENHKPYKKSAHKGVHEFLNAEGENHLIIPIGLAKLHLNEEFISVETVDYNTFAETKRIAKHTTINRDYETIILDTYDKNNTIEFNSMDDDTFYRRPEFKNKSTH